MDPTHRGILIIKHGFSMCMYLSVSAVSNICDETLSVLDEREGYIASPGYTELHSATDSFVISQYQPPYRCALTVNVPPDHGYGALYFYIKDLDFRSMHGPTTPTDSKENNLTSAQIDQETCIQFAEILANNNKETVQIVCSLQDIKARGPVFMSKTFHVEITYWSINVEFNDFLLHYIGKYASLKLTVYGMDRLCGHKIPCIHAQCCPQGWCGVGWAEWGRMVGGGWVRVVGVSGGRWVVVVVSGLRWGGDVSWDGEVAGEVSSIARNDMLPWGVPN